MVTIRAASQEDAAAIAHVHVESWRTTYAGIVPQPFLDSLDATERTRQWQEWLTWDVPVLVAEANGELVGFISGGPVREPVGDYDAELYAIYLLQHAQGQGIGTSLLGALANLLQAKGFRRMAVWVLASNRSSHFYENTGALPLSTKEIEIGGVTLPAVAFGWPELETITSRA